jgi:hypothetical protein
MAGKRNDGGVLRHERRRILLFQASGNGGDVGLGLLDGRSRTQSADDTKIVRGPTLGGKKCVGGDPQLRSVGVIEPGRHDADHRERLAHQLDFAPENSRVRAIGSTPQAVAENDHARRAELLFGGLKSSTKLRRNADNVEKILGDLRTVGALRSVAAAGVHGALAEGGHRGKTVALPLPVFEIRQRHLNGAVRLVDFRDPRQLIRTRIRQRVEQHRFDHAEQRRARAHAQRDGQNRNQGQGRGATQGAERVTDEIENHEVRRACDQPRPLPYYQSRGVLACPIPGLYRPTPDMSGTNVS